MPIMTLSKETLSFVWTDINALPTIPNYDKIVVLCWGWGLLKSNPVKFYQEIRGNKVFTVRQWVWLGGDGPKRQEVRVDIKGVYAEGCQYLEKGDPIFFLGVLKYDRKFSNMKGFPFFLVDAHMVIPPYSADGREFCARQQAIVERRNDRFIDSIDEEQFSNGMRALEERLKGERDGRV